MIDDAEKTPENAEPKDDAASIKVLLIGPFPPPYGGIATRVDRLRRLLADHRDFRVAALNVGDARKQSSAGVIPVMSSRDFLRKLARFARMGYLVHLETNGHNTKSWMSALVCVLAGLLTRRRSFIAFGSGALPRYVGNVKGWRRFVVRATVRGAGRLFCRNAEMRDALVGVGAERGRVVIVSGFIGVDPNSLGELPDHVRSFVDCHEPLIGAAASSLDPEYAIPLMLDAFRYLVAVYPRVGLLLLGIGDDARVSLPVPVSEDSICLVGPLPHPQALATMQKLDVFLRPTLFDGDSNTVREALALGVPVVASDTGFRPRGVLKFPVGDVVGLVAKVREAIEKGSTMDTKSASDEPNPIDVVISQYREVTGYANCHGDSDLTKSAQRQDPA